MICRYTWNGPLCLTLISSLRLISAGTYARILFVDFSSAFNTIIPALLLPDSTCRCSTFLMCRTYCVFMFLCYVQYLLCLYVLCLLYAPIHQSKFQVGVNLLGNKYNSDSEVMRRILLWIHLHVKIQTCCKFLQISPSDLRQAVSAAVLTTTSHPGHVNRPFQPRSIISVESYFLSAGECTRGPL